MKNNEVNGTTWFRIRASHRAWFLRTAMLLLALSAGAMPAAIGDDLVDLPWRYTLKKPASWLEETYDDVKWQEGRGGLILA